MKISVYITSYNQASYLKSAILSVIRQTIRPHEIIIIDDGSVDDSKTIIKEFSTLYPNLVIPVFNKDNIGIVENRNLAKKLFKGDFLVGLDGDDLWFPKKLETEKRAIQDLKADFCFSWHQRFFHEEELQDTTCLERKKAMVVNNLEELVLLRKYGSSLFRSEMVSRKALEETGEYDNNLSLYEDYDYKIRLSQKFRGARVFAVTQGYRDNPSGLSKRSLFEHYQALSYIYLKCLRNTEFPISSEYKNYFYLKLESLLLKALNKSEISLEEYYREIGNIKVYNSELIRLTKSYLIPFKLWRKKI